jgi:hypothetical protein
MMRALAWLAAWLAACVAASGVPPLPDGAPARVVSFWPADRSGDHRVRVRVGAGSVNTLSVLEIEWRLPLGVSASATVREEHGRAPLKHVVPLVMSSERALLLLRPRVPGTHMVHFLPYDESRCAETGPAASCRITHTRVAPSRRLPRWVPSWARNRSAEEPLSALARQALLALPRVQVVSIESRSARDSFDPMELRATAAELAVLRARARARPLLLTLTLTLSLTLTLTLALTLPSWPSCARAHGRVPFS